MIDALRNFFAPKPQPQAKVLVIIEENYSDLTLVEIMERLENRFGTNRVTIIAGVKATAYVIK